MQADFQMIFFSLFYSERRSDIDVCGRRKTTKMVEDAFEKIFNIIRKCGGQFHKNYGLVRDSNPGPLAPKARIIPLDQRAAWKYERFFSI